MDLIYKVSINNKIKKAIEISDITIVDELFYLLEPTSPDYLEILLSLLPKYWQTFHHDVLLELQRLKNIKAIDSVYNSIIEREHEFEKLKNTWFYHRAIWILADIGTIESKNKLLLLTNVENQGIKLSAQKRLDEWENELQRKRLNPLSEGWYLTDEEDDDFTEELYNELADDHPLFGIPLKVIAHDDRVYDEVFCKHLDKQNLYSMVHLTWSQAKELKGFPSFETGFSWEWFIEES